MIEKINDFTKTIICTTMMVMLIKMIVPDGKNKKYILFVCGLITTLVILEPLLSFMNINVDEVLAKNEAQYEEVKVDDSMYKEAVKDSFENAMMSDVINRLKENGYNVSDVRVEYDDTYKPTKIYLNLESEEGYVQPVKIEVSSNKVNKNVSEVTKNKIKEIIKENYGIKKDNIFIEGSSK